MFVHSSDDNCNGDNKHFLLKIILNMKESQFYSIHTHTHTT